MVGIWGSNWSTKITDHFTCISVNVIYCITGMLHIGEMEKIGRLLLWTPTRCQKKKPTLMRPNHLRAILIFLITPTTKWQFADYPYTTETQKTTKISNENSSFNWVHSIHRGSMNTSHSTKVIHQFINLRLHRHNYLVIFIKQ